MTSFLKSTGETEDSSNKKKKKREKATCTLILRKLLLVGTNWQWLIIQWLVRLTRLRDRMPFRGTWTSWRNGCTWTSWGSTRPSAGSCTWVGATPTVNTGWGRRDGEQPWGGGLRGAGGWKGGHDSMCPGSPESQPHPRLHPQQCGHRAREGIPALCPALLRPPRSPASFSGALSTGQSWSCGSGAGGSPSNHPRAGTPLLGGKAGRAGAAQPGEEKAAGRPSSSCQCLKGA